jgi:hypothetical protein
MDDAVKRPYRVLKVLKRMENVLSKSSKYGAPKHKWTKQEHDVIVNIAQKYIKLYKFGSRKMAQSILDDDEFPSNKKLYYSSKLI